MEIYIKNSKKIRILAKTAHKSRNSYYRFALSGYDYNMLNTGGWWCYKMAEDVSGIYTGIIGIITEQTPFAQILTNDRFKFFNNAQPKLKIHQGSFPASYSSLFTIHETPKLLLRYFLKDLGFHLNVTVLVIKVDIVIDRGAIAFSYLWN